jgi:hypothetical protein
MTHVPTWRPERLVFPPPASRVIFTNPPPYRPAPVNNDIIVIATFGSEIEASIAQASLDAAGIDSILLRDDAAGIIPSMSFLKGVRVAVRRGDAEEARKQLQL